MERLLGIVYVGCWSISVYPVLYKNWKTGNANAVSFDYVVLNTVGYVCLMVSMLLQKLLWINDGDEKVTPPEIAVPDLVYCGHGTFMCFMLLSQFLVGTSVWRFPTTIITHTRMHYIYSRIFKIVMFLVFLMTVVFLRQTLSGNMTNALLLSYCNKLSMVKILMSLTKHLPQVKHNFERKNMADFPIQSTCIDFLGSVCSLSQLILRLSSKPQGLSLMSFVTNFGKAGVGLVTLLFNIVYISQWVAYT